MQDCPVCGKAGLNDEVQQCPQCHSDLECFVLLDALSEQTTSSITAGNQQLTQIQATLADIRGDLERSRADRWEKWYWLASFAVIVLVALWLYANGALERRTEYPPVIADAAVPPAADLNPLLLRITALDRHLEQLENQLLAIAASQETISANQETITALSTALAEHAQPAAQTTELPAALPESTATTPAASNEQERFFYHELKPSDTLWDIAEQYYSKGQYYPVLLEYNPGLGIYFGRDLEKIKVPRDPQQVQAVLNDLVSVTSDGTLFHYKVIDGDSWPNLSRRFFGHSGKATALRALNHNAHPVPGERVLIPLQ